MVPAQAQASRGEERSQILLPGHFERCQFFLLVPNPPTDGSAREGEALVTSPEQALIYKAHITRQALLVSSQGLGVVTNRTAGLEPKSCRMSLSEQLKRATSSRDTAVVGRGTEGPGAASATDARAPGSPVPPDTEHLTPRCQNGS